MLRACFQLCALVVLHGALAFASVEKIGADLYAYISSNDSSSNSVFLVGNNGILVVDTGMNAEEGAKLLVEIRRVSPLPVQWIVNTHYHPDHRGGNDVVGPDAVIISTAFTQEKVAGNRKAANRTVEEVDTMEGVILFVGGYPVHIYAPGPAHTRGDLLVYFPQQKALATGDLFLNNSCPYMDDGDLDNWINALDSMLVLAPNRVVPGHFAVGEQAELSRFRNYMVELRAQVQKMWSQGLSLEQIQQRMDMKAYRDFRQFPQFKATFADNAAAYYRQVQQNKNKSSSL